MQGTDHRGADTQQARLLLLTLTIVMMVCLGGLGSAVAYPDTFECKEAPTLQFPDTVTLGNEYFYMINCGSIGTDAGDFVGILVATADGAHIANYSEYETTENGVEWVAPLSDTNGNVWGQINIEPGLFDCNSTGVPYAIHSHWDGQLAERAFEVVCPTIEFDFYRIEVPNWEKLKVTAQVTDNRGYALRDIPCTASVIDVSTDGNYTTVKQETIAMRTDMSGKLRYTIETGLLHDLLQGYEYTVSVSCLGGDGNFSFTVEEMNDENLRNPVYFTIVFISDNIVPIVFALFVAAAAFGAIYYIFKRENN